MLYERRGADLVLEAPVSMTEAALGATVEVPTPDGRVALKIPAGTADGAMLRIRGKGAPRLNETGKGDLLVRVKLVIPTGLTDEQRELLAPVRRSAAGRSARGQAGLVTRGVSTRCRRPMTGTARCS